MRSASCSLVLIVLLPACGTEVAGAPLPLEDCTFIELSLRGSVDGSDIGGTYVQETGSGSSTFAVSSFDGGLFYFFLDEPAAPGVPLDTSGAIRLPPSNALAESWLCAGPGSTWTGDSEAPVSAPASLSLRSLRLLGPCAGAAPIPGELVYCPGHSNDFCDAGLHGTIDGVAIDPFVGTGGSTPTGTVAVNEERAIVVIELEETTVTRGFIRMPDNGADPGAHYCFDSGTMERETPDDLNAVYTLTGLRRLGTCAEAAAASGELEISFCR